MLQIECGREVQPDICRRYPRVRNEYTNCEIYVNRSGCEGVMEKLFDTGRFELTDRKKLGGASEQDEELSGLLDTMDILQDNTVLFEKRIEMICGVNCFADERKLFDVSVLNMRTIFNEHYNIPQYTENVLKRYDCDHGYENYCTDFSGFEKKYPDWRHCFENVLANHIAVMRYPYVDSRLKPEDAGAGLKNVYMFMRMISAAYTAETDGPTSLADTLLMLFKTAEQPDFYRIVRRCGACGR